MSTEKRKLTILVPREVMVDTSSTSTFFNIPFVTVNENDEISNVGRHAEGLEGFNDLEIRVWISWSFDSFIASSFEVLYKNPYSVDLARAELMLKTLKRINKLSSKWVVKPASFGQYVTLVCHGLGIKTYAELEGTDQGWHNENTYRLTDIKYLADNIDAKIKAVENAKYPKAG